MNDCERGCLSYIHVAVLAYTVYIFALGGGGK